MKYKALKRERKIRGLAFAAGAVFLFCCSVVFADTTSSGHFIVKLRGFNGCADQVFAAKQPFADYLDDHASSLDQLISAWGIAEVSSLDETCGMDTGKVSPFTDVYLFAVGAGKDAQEAANAFSNDPHVVYAHPDYVIQPDQLSSDPWSAEQWALEGIHADVAWRVSQGAGVIVAIVDSGVDYTHPDIAANIWQNLNETLNGVDDDGNGYIDDIQGWNFQSSSNEVMDTNGHGTALAGVVAAVKDNSEGISGVAPLATVMPVKIFNSSTNATISRLIKGIVYAVDNGAQVVSTSFSCTKICPSIPALEDTIRYAHQQNAVLVFSSGNSGINVQGFSPQNQRETIAVASFGEDRSFSEFSNSGLGIDLSAPGENIVSLGLAHEYATTSGTSLSAAYAAGSAALILSNNPQLTNDEVLKLLRATAVNNEDADLNFGYGQLNLERMLDIDQIPAVIIKSPQFNARILKEADDFFEITGTADGNGFVSYSLFYSQQEDLKNWEILQKDVASPVAGTETDELLGTLDHNEFVPGDFVLRLKVATEDDLGFEDWMPFTIVGDAASVEVIAQNEFRKENPFIRDGRVVWMEEGTAGVNMMVKDLASGITEHVATVGFNYFWPSLSDDKIVWIDDSEGEGPQVYLYDILTRQTTRLSEGFFSNSVPYAQGDHVVWMAKTEQEGEFEIILHTISTNQTRAVTNDNVYQSSPVVFENQIVWEEYISGNYDIVLYNIQTGQRQMITNDQWDQREPYISGDRIVWSDMRNQNTDIYLFDLTTGEERQVTKSIFGDRRPVIDGNTIVWTRYNMQDSDVYYYDMVEGTIGVVSNQDGFQNSAHISKDQVVWADTRNGSSDIFMLTLPKKNIEPPVFDLVTDQNGFVGQAVAFGVFARDPEGGTVSLSASWNGAAVQVLGASFLDLGSGNGLLEWTPQAGDTGDFVFTFTATDEGGLQSQMSVTVKVSDHLIGARMISPEEGSVIQKKKVDFQWTEGHLARYYIVKVGTRPGAGDIAQKLIKRKTETSVNVNLNGKDIFVTLSTYGAGAVETNEYVYSTVKPKSSKQTREDILMTAFINYLKDVSQKIMNKQQKVKIEHLIKVLEEEKKKRNSKKK